jgi:tRNA(Ile)-lysidine synthase
MANSRKSRLASLAENVTSRVAPLIPAHSSILVGLSGGVDSVVLLHILHKLSSRFSWNISALHVHHGISPNADVWSDFCTQLCAKMHVSLSIERVDITPIREHGVEAAARKLRHEAFARQSCDFVAVAHHLDDQAETLLLQLLRGTGVRGASAMPEFAVRGGSAPLVRPLLHCSREEILNYARAHGLGWIEDESNANDNVPRNFLRHRVMPLLAEKFPAYRDTLMRSAQHFAEASHLLDVLALQDSAGSIQAETVSVAVLRALDPARARNVLRYFLSVNGAPMPQAVQLDDMLRQLLNAGQDAEVCVEFGGWEVRRYRGAAYVLRSLIELNRDFVLPWHGEAEIYWPMLAARLHIDVEPHPAKRDVRGFAISAAKLRRAPVTFRLRQGGESIRPGPMRVTRSVKNLFQECHVPPWQRDRLPFVYCGDELVYVTGVAVAADYQPASAEAIIRIRMG